MKYLRQEKHYHALGPHFDPLLRINSGETIVVETLDNMGNRVNSVNDSDQIRSPINPLSGPIYIENAEKGDCLEVIIDDIKVLRGHGWTGQTSEWGFIEMCSPIWNILNDKIPTVIKICRIENDKIFFPLKDGKEIVLPLRPIVGTIGTAPEVEVPSTTPGPYGGNMDCLEVKPSNKLYLPVYVPGGLLFLGDIHASQGHGELGGAPVEVSAETKITINLIKDRTIGCPRIVSEDHLMTVGSSKPTENAIRIALCELVSWLKEDYNFDIWDANLLITSVAEIECSQITNPLFTTALKFPKKYLP
ncbi:MAG: acetamidase/formamidase family protein [Candidatus Bathyarchaeota archaeon]|nr:acetamidase/formamidase family protein [Candidatus Bathyarchaeota archaeon]